jgi:uncharacterized protein
MMDPLPLDAQASRYSLWRLPQTRYLPGRTPRPERDGQTKRVENSQETPALSETWNRNESYLYGVDLYNFAYWWECHEVFEDLWHAAGRKTPPARFLQALIQIAAGNLKDLLGSQDAAKNLWRRGLAGLEPFKPVYMGIDIEMFVADALAYAEHRRETPAVIRLQGLEGSEKS